MQNGGARSGAGRKPGSSTQRTREIADRCAEEGVTPLEIIVTVMREQWQAYQTNKDPAAAQVAILAANHAAPYIHPKLSQVDAPIQLENFTGSATERGQQVLDALAAGELTPVQANTVMQAIGTQIK